MPRGGKREGAGRKTGAVTVRSRKIADQAVTEGITPLEVMLGNMRFYHQAAEVALNRLLTGDAKPVDIIAEHAPEQLERIEEGAEAPAPNVVDAFKLVLALRDKAGEAAKDAAGYVHARIAAVEQKERTNDHIPLAERLKAYATRDAIDASEGRVVALKARQ